ncbi:hypothetical protein QZH41_013117 [Actinostola sp. cb2023]|nr:hypothetical protein QZH41_013117 [Actinostola sp. cb2023]
MNLRIIRLCLDIYCTSPKAFDTIKQHLILPSKRLIRYYKNAIPPKSGWDHDVMQWCSKEAKNLGLNEEQRWSGLIFDEMAIQEDLQFSSVNGKTKLVGAVSLGKTYEDTQFLINGKDEVEIASKVMQFCLVTDSGFRFALSHFPVKTMPAISLLEEFWRGVELCQRYGFRIYWLVCDGGEPNRSFIKLLFPHGSDASQHNFVAYNMHTGKELVVMLDCKHNFKKIRNNLEKSTLKDKSPRQLMLNGNSILFQHWKDAYNWDRNEHSIKVNEHLSDDHFNLTPKSRMRNKLAEDLLDKKMLYLMEQFKIHLFDQGKRAQAEELNETIRLLTFTSELIDLFTRKDKLTSCYDARIIKAKEFIDHLKTWKGNTKTAKEFISDKLWFDLQAMVIGLEQVVKIKSRAFPDTGIIKPVIINQDVIENIFCQVRGSNGQNNNPTYLSYGSTITSVNIGQDAISKKGNTRGIKECLTRACLPVEHPFKKKKKNHND